MIISRHIYVSQRITQTVNSTEQKRLLMDLDVNMRTGSCPYCVKFYGALFREVCSHYSRLNTEAVGVGRKIYVLKRKL